MKVEHLNTQTAGGQVTDASANATHTNLLNQTRWSVALVVAVFTASSVITLVFWKILPGSFRVNEQTDYAAYYEPVARNLLAGRGLTLNGEPATSYPPGYPFVLASIFEVSHWFHIREESGLSTLAAVGMALVSVLIFFLARMIWGVWPAIISSSLWMTYPFALWLTKQPNNEIPFMVLFYGGLCLFWYALLQRKQAKRLYFACGFTFGLAMLIRPIAIGIGFVAVLIVWFVLREMTPRLRFLLIAMLLLGNLVAVLPWEAWAYRRTGKVVLLGTIGVKGIRDGLTFAVTSKGYREEINVSPDVAGVMKDFLVRSEGIVTLGNVVSVVAMEFRTHPAATTKLYLLKIGRSWYATDSGRKELPILLIQIPYLALALWGFGKLWSRGSIHRNFAISVLLVVIYFWGMTVLALSILRYMVPVTGLLFLLIAGGVFPFSSRSQIGAHFE